MREWYAELRHNYDWVGIQNDIIVIALAASLIASVAYLWSHIDHIVELYFPGGPLW